MEQSKPFVFYHCVKKKKEKFFTVIIPRTFLCAVSTTVSERFRSRLANKAAFTLGSWARCPSTVLAGH